ncbi:bifunctional phosphoribosyl-AMP cyclohydrolase/phosphoribosyl-ATP diphosphatase HisIE [Thermaerobacter sp. PB12/4term]|uniref:bifunctional phosphoribosyl-AMP cyclohydrolase/phosphoribosyl-ATP diphosphatase HisIE n=1 Tax=Thermaerobacter sp. PB12/4term TaxID=2293838 RepID=UPI001FAE384D|nr:bifunctional phosphoribosyl-AMP cyclohydrolase/phosphoribosyl-ATP diphosphatase HisIE [Thermaerobacter sp. PB12/4term]
MRLEKRQVGSVADSEHLPEDGERLVEGWEPLLDPGHPLLESVCFDERGLVPVVVQDAERGDVLMLAYANREALARTLAEGRAWFFSRSRQRLWLKGETSGHTLRVREARIDCDGDAVLYRVEPAGPACHTGERSCFYRTATIPAGSPATPARTGSPATPSPTGTQAVAARTEARTGAPEGPIARELSRLEAVIRERVRERPAGSYTTQLLEAGLPRILQKVGEEAVETVVAGGHQDGHRLVEEAADLLYHLTVLLVVRNAGWDAVAAELGRRAAAR